MKKLTLIISYLLFFACLISAKQFPYNKGPVEMTLEADKQTLTLAESLQFKWQIKYPDTYQIRLPEFSDVNNFLTYPGDDSTHLDPEGNIIFKTSHHLEPLTDGQLQIPPLAFEFTPKDPNNTKAVIINTDPIQIQVTKTIDINDPNVTRQAEQIRPVAAPPFKVKWWMFLPIILVLLFTLGLWLAQRKKNIPANQTLPARPPHEIALEKLKQLLQQNLVQAGKIKLFYQRLSDILRNYIEARFRINAPDLTTEEFLAEITANKKLTPEDKKILADFLTQCDLVKFAKHQPQQQDIDKSVHLAKDFINKTTPAQTPREEAK